MVEAGAVKGRDLRLEVLRFRLGDCRDRLIRGVVWLDFAVPHKHLNVDVTVTSPHEF
jgi:hypothetical protein